MDPRLPVIAMFSGVKIKNRSPSSHQQIVLCRRRTSFNDLPFNPSLHFLNAIIGADLVVREVFEIPVLIGTQRKSGFSNCE